MTIVKNLESTGFIDENGLPSDSILHEAEELTPNQYKTKVQLVKDLMELHSDITDEKQLGVLFNTYWDRSLGELKILRNLIM